MKFVTDENFHGPILRALLAHFRENVIVRVQDVGLAEEPDPVILDWAARHERMLLTHDFKTMPQFAYERVAASLPMPGVFQVDDTAPISVIVYDMQLIAECSTDEDWRDHVWYIPFPPTK